MGQPLVAIEVHGWLADLLEPGAGRTISLPLRADATLASVLVNLTEIHPRVGPVLWAVRGSCVTEYVSILVDGRLSEICGHLEQHLSGGTRVILLPAYAGG